MRVKFSGLFLVFNLLLVGCGDILLDSDIEGGLLKMAPAKSFGYFELSPEDYFFINNCDLNNLDTKSGVNKIEYWTNSIYNQFYDQFDFIAYVVDNDAIPEECSDVTKGFLVNNNISGLGLTTGKLPDASDFNTDILQSVILLYSLESISSGELLEALSTRWLNYALEDSSPYWEAGISVNTNSIFNSHHIYSDVELYMMGLLHKEDVRGAANISLRGDVISSVGERAPNNLTAQKDFNILFVILTKENISRVRLSSYNDSIEDLLKESITYEDYTLNPSLYKSNFHAATKQIGSLNRLNLTTISKWLFF